jgi:hypothetical protein
VLVRANAAARALHFGDDLLPIALIRLSRIGFHHAQAGERRHRYNGGMSVATGRVRGGQLVLDGEPEPLPEGKRFTVVIEDEEEGFHLDAESIRLLRAASEGIRKGTSFTEEEILKELDGG